MAFPGTTQALDSNRLCSLCILTDHTGCSGAQGLLRQLDVS